MSKLKERPLPLTWDGYRLWLDAAKKEHGKNMLYWPAWVRRQHNRIAIRDTKPRPKQLAIPYGNTGVTEGAESTGVNTK